jgi:uncharacterized coiled-coil protein SlyX
MDLAHAGDLIESLRAQLAECQRERDANERLVDRLCSEVLEINNKLEAAKVDAERYRWLRDMESEWVTHNIVSVTRYGGVTGLRDSDLDQAIDAAMGEEQPC